MNEPKHQLPWKGYNSGAVFDATGSQIFLARSIEECELAVAAANALAQPQQWPVPEKLEMGKWYWFWNVVPRVWGMVNHQNLCDPTLTENYRGPIEPPPMPKEPWEVAFERDVDCRSRPATKQEKILFKAGYEAARKDGKL